MTPSKDSKYDGMRLTVFQLRPVGMSGYILDGSNGILMNVLSHFSDLGVKTTIHHPATADSNSSFYIRPEILVAPVAPMLSTSIRGSTWADPASHVAAIETIWESAANSDIFYIHGANYPYADIDLPCPTVHSAHDFVYHEAVTGVLNFRRDRLVAVSEYTASCIRHLLSRIRHLPDDCLHTVPNGFDAGAYSYSQSYRVRDKLGLSKELSYILYPHRSDLDKGIDAALELMAVLRGILTASHYSKLRLLVPSWEAPEYDLSHDRRPTLQPEAEKYAVDLGVLDKVHVHQWLRSAEMPAYYSIGDVTLCLGSVPEAFGNVHIESLLTGTPVVMTRVGAQRTSIPDGLVRKVDPNQVVHAAHHVAEILLESERATDEIRSYISDRYSMANMLEGYKSAILDCDVRPSVLNSHAAKRDMGASLCIPPWAAALESGYYHDYAGYCTDESFLKYLEPIQRGITVSAFIRDYDVDFSEIRRWQNAGLVSLI